jgi:hypothetical protein
VTDMQDRASVASLVTAGTALPGPDLRAVAVTERRFDRQLIALSFPPRTEPFVRLLYRVNQARATLTSTRSGSSAASSGCRRPIPADHGKPAVN